MLLIKLSEFNKKEDNSSYFKAICILRIHLSTVHIYNHPLVHPLLLPYTCSK
jgi:hypothetical protein